MLMLCTTNTVKLVQGGKWIRRKLAQFWTNAIVPARGITVLFILYNAELAQHGNWKQYLKKIIKNYLYKAESVLKVQLKYQR
jgi:hypothetical protein